MMATVGRNAVRFKDTPAFVRVADDVSMSSGDSNTTLMKALQLDESSSIHSEAMNEKSVASDSPTERVQWVGRTPHAKVLEAKRSRKTLDELMKMPELAPLNNSISMMAPSFIIESSAMHNDNESTPSDISFSPVGVAMNERSQITGTPYVQPLKGKNVFLDTPFCPSEAPHSLARSTPSSNESYSFDLLSTEADRILSSMPNSTPLSTRSTPNYISPLSEPSTNHPRLSSIHQTPANVKAEQISFEDEEPSTTKKIVVKSAVKPLRVLNQNSAAFERPKQISEESFSKTMKSASRLSDTPKSLLMEKENQIYVNQSEKKPPSEMKVQIQQYAPTPISSTFDSTVSNNQRVQITAAKVALRNESPAKALLREVTPRSMVEESVLSSTMPCVVEARASISVTNNDNQVHAALTSLEMKPKLIKSVSMNVDLPQTHNRPPEYIAASNNDEVECQRQRHKEMKQHKSVDAPVVKVDQILHQVSAVSSDEGVSLGKGPIFACIRAKRVEHLTARTMTASSMECKEKMVPAFPIDAPSVVHSKPPISSSQHDTGSGSRNTLHLANAWATPRNTRKTVPHNYFVNEKVDVPRIASFHGHHDHSQTLSSSISQHVTITVPEEDAHQKMEEVSLVPSIPSDVGTHTVALPTNTSTVEPLVNVKQLHVSNPPTQIVSSGRVAHQDVSIQVDREMFKQTKIIISSCSSTAPVMKETAVQSSFDSSIINLSPIGKTAFTEVKHQVEHVQTAVVSNNLNESICSYALEDLLPKYDSPQNSRIVASYTSTPSAGSPVRQHKQQQQRFDTMSCLVSSNMSKSASKMSSLDVSPSTSMIQNRSTSLGSATRIVVADRQKYMQDQWNTQQQIPWDYFNEYEDPVELDKGEPKERVEIASEPEFAYIPRKDLTVLTDVAVASFTQTMMMDNEESQSVDCNTTFTLDQSSCDRLNQSCLSNETAEQTFPKLAIKSLKRAVDSPLDVKEINFDTAPGEFTTVMLTFSNHRPKDLTLSADCAFLRVEPSYYARNIQNGKSSSMPPLQEGEDYFSVSPKLVTIPANGQAELFVTFSPVAESEGIYSGVMKIKFGNKSYTMLLRGESSFDFSISTPQVVSQSMKTQEEQEVKTDYISAQVVSVPPLVKEAMAGASIPRETNHHTATHLITPKSVFQKKLKILQEQMVELTKKMLWIDTPQRIEAFPVAEQPSVAPSSSAIVPAATAPSTNVRSSFDKVSTTQSIAAESKCSETKRSTSSSIGFQSVKSSSSTTKQSNVNDVTLFPPTMSFSSATMKSVLTIFNNTNRPKIMRLSSTMPQQIILSTTFATVTPNSQYKVEVYIEKLSREVLQSMKGINMKKISKHEIYHFGSIECSFDNQHLTVPVSINGSLIKPLLLQVSTPASAATKSLTWTVDTKGGDGPTPFTGMKAERSDFYDGDFEATRLKQNSMMSTPQQFGVSNNDSYFFDQSVATATTSTIKTIEQVFAPQITTAATSSQQSNDGGVNNVNSGIAMTEFNTSSSKQPHAMDFKESAIIRSHLEHQQRGENSASGTTIATNTDIVTQHNYIEFNQPHSHISSTHAAVSSNASVASSCMTSYKAGFFFRKSQAQFGSVAIGNLVRTKVELCNATNNELTVYLGGLNLPFSNLHNEAVIRPRSFIRIPVRFVPTVPGEFNTELVAQTSDGKQICSIQLTGFAYK